MDSSGNTHNMTIKRWAFAVSGLLFVLGMGYYFWPEAIAATMEFPQDREYVMRKFGVSEKDAGVFGVSFDLGLRRNLAIHFVGINSSMTNFPAMLKESNKIREVDISYAFFNRDWLLKD